MNHKSYFLLDLSFIVCTVFSRNTANYIEHSTKEDTHAGLSNSTGLPFSIMTGDILNALSQYNNQTTLDLSQQRKPVENIIAHKNINLKRDYHAVTWRK